MHNVVSGAFNGMPFTIFDYQRVAIVQAGVFASFETVTVWTVQVPTVLPHFEADHPPPTGEPRRLPAESRLISLPRGTAAVTVQRADRPADDRTQASGRRLPAEVRLSHGRHAGWNASPSGLAITTV